MSIFSKIGSIFTTIEDFITNLFTSVDKEWKNLEPTAQALFTNLIKWGNLIKTYITSPPAAGLTWSFIITEAEALLGPSMVAAINSVLSQALSILQIGDEAFTDPALAGQALLTYLSKFTGTALGKEIFKISGTVIELLSEIEGNTVTMILAWVYKTFFTQATSAAPLSPELQQAATNLGNQATASNAPAQNANEPAPIAAPLPVPDPASGS